MSKQSAPITGPTERFEMLPLASIVESKTNPRRRFKHMEDITESAKRSGIIVPISVRPLLGKKDHWELIAGARRLRAAALAGLATIKAVIGQYTDVQVAEMQLVENGQREDVHPLEDAEGMERWLKLTKSTQTALAERIGKDVAFVHRRLALLNLIDSLRKRFYDDELTTAHAVVLARLRPEDQAAVEKDGLMERDGYHDESGKYIQGKELRNARELSAWISQRFLLVLKDVPWSLDDPLLVPAAGSCAACQKRTGAQVVMFEDLTDKKDRCLDISCYTSKKLALLKAAEKKTPGLVRVFESFAGVADMKTYGVKEGNGMREAKAKCKSPKPAIIAIGEHFGKEVTVCLDNKCRNHGYSYAAPSADQKKKAAARNLERKVDEEVRRQVIHLFTSAKPKGDSVPIGIVDLRAIAYEMFQGDAETAGVVGVKMPKESWKSREPIEKALPKCTGPQLLKVILIALADNDFKKTVVAEMAKARNVDLVALRKTIEAGFKKAEPEPKKAPAKKKAAKK